MRKHKQIGKKNTYRKNTTSDKEAETLGQIKNDEKGGRGK